MTVPAPIRWEDGKLWLLDQRLLPRQVVFEEQRDAESVARAIRELRVRGAPAIGIAAAYGMALAQRCGTDLEQAARQLCAARPTAVNLGWAVKRLLDAHDAGVPFHVFVDETRPVLQGARLTSWELTEAGIDHTLICDSAAAHLMAENAVDLVIVGADRVTANGDTVNKIGTRALAIVAQYHGVPFYVACPSSTFDPDTPSGDEVVIEERPSAEVTAYLPTVAGVKTRNPAFDVTPAGLVKAYITDRGLLPASDGFQWSPP